jgi:hypothetical protein
MAIIDITTGIIRGKLGNIVFEYRMGTNYARKYVDRKPPPSANQAAHRKLYAQLQGLGSLWLAGLIKPYYLGDQTQKCAYRELGLVQVNSYINHLSPPDVVPSEALLCSLADY